MSDNSEEPEPGADEAPPVTPEEEYTENFLKEFIEKTNETLIFTDKHRKELLGRANKVKPGDKEACNKLADLWTLYHKEADTDPESKPKKPDKVPDTVLMCSNGCGFNTRWPDKQALQTKGRPTKTESGQYLCPNCDANGSSSTLKPYP